MVFALICALYKNNMGIGSVTTSVENLRLLSPSINVSEVNGELVLKSPVALDNYARANVDWLVHWAKVEPERIFLAERTPTGDWDELTYAQALQKVKSIGQGLLNLGASLDRPIAILSGNSIDHALISLAASFVGVPYAPISPAYSLLDGSFGKLKYIIEKITPSIVFVQNQGMFANALEAIGMKSTSIDQMYAEPTSEVDQAYANITPDTVVKILFTSGSTGMPKGVINTQKMITVNQRQSALVWQFLEDEPPVLVDWLPWNHTFGGNWTFNLVLCNGGTLYIDDGKPVPGMFEASLTNLKEISPSMYFNVPKGFELLLPFLENDSAFREHFFSNCRFILYAGAALPKLLWDRLEAVINIDHKGQVVLVSSWGSTETAPLCLGGYDPVLRQGTIGLPVPGCEIKLISNAGKLEARVKGPHVTPGYFRDQETTNKAFDDAGYYCIGDALKFYDEQDHTKGLVFDGRVAEDFKLKTGTWVHVGILRVQLIDACGGVIQDAVITGHDRDEVGALVFLNLVKAKDMSREEITIQISNGLAQLVKLNKGTSSTKITRVVILEGMPRVDLGEITDKGYINQRAALQHRSNQVSLLYENPVNEVVITLKTN